MKHILVLLGLLISSSVRSEITAADARSLAITSDKSVVIAGMAIKNKQNVMSVVRYLSNGIIDTNFGTNGITLTAVGDQSEANSLLLQDTGKILVGGFTLINGSTYAVLIRYDINGTIDTSFGADLTGFVVEQNISNAQIAEIKQQSDGKIIVVGTYSIDGQLSAFIVRYSSEGILDTTFGTNGIVTKTVGYHTGALGCQIQSDDKIIVCGFSIIETRQVIVFRLNANGTDDTSYGNNGLTSTQVGASAQAEAVTIDANNKILVTGSSENMLLLIRYNTDGSLDQSFGNEGVLATRVGNINGGFGVAIDGNGTIISCGFADQMLALIRFNSQGQLDNSFNNIGYITKLVDNIGNCAKSIAIYNSQIYIAGSAGDDITIQRYNSDGLLDTTWHFSGIVDIFSENASNTSVLFDQKKSGVNGGTFTAGSWITRELNQLVSSSANVTLENNHFTLQPGVYEISVAAPAYMCGAHKIRLQNITSNETIKVGTAAFSSSETGGAVSNSLLEAAVVVTNENNFEIQHRCSVTRNNDGFGIATGFDESEVYTIVKIVQK